jgi:RNA polymerase sigma factor (sigma-70 family)
MTDQRIIELIRAGKNDKALNALYQQFPMIRKLIRSKGGTRSDAEDVFQEALIVLLKKAASPDFQLTAKLSTYLYSVSRFLWNDQLKRRRPQVPVDESPAFDAAETTGLEEAIREEARIRVAEQIIHNLKERCRELLLLFYHDKLSLLAIAERMGYGSENAAKTQKYKCLEAARNQFKSLTAAHTL